MGNIGIETSEGDLDTGCTGSWCPLLFKINSGPELQDECDLILPAESVTAVALIAMYPSTGEAFLDWFNLGPEAAQMAFAIRHTTGIVCIVADKAGPGRSVSLSNLASPTLADAAGEIRALRLASCPDLNTCLWAIFA